MSFKEITEETLQVVLQKVFAPIQVSVDGIRSDVDAIRNDYECLREVFDDVQSSIEDLKEDYNDLRDKVGYLSHHRASAPYGIYGGMDRLPTGAAFNEKPRDWRRRGPLDQD